MFSKAIFLYQLFIRLQRSQAAGMEEEDAQCFLKKLVEEFPAALKEDAPLPVSSLSRRVSLEELQGESLELGQRLLAARYGYTLHSFFWLGPQYLLFVTHANWGI